jgi:hypothetical protein
VATYFIAVQHGEPREVPEGVVEAYLEDLATEGTEPPWDHLLIMTSEMQYPKPCQLVLKGNPRAFRFYVGNLSMHEVEV